VLRAKNSVDPRPQSFGAVDHEQPLRLGVHAAATNCCSKSSTAPREVTGNHRTGRTLTLGLDHRRWRRRIHIG
jgi:hypothetical protein